MSDPDALRNRLRAEGTLILSVKVIPRASKSDIAGITPEGVLKAKVAAIPEKGKANEELRRLLAEFFAVSKRSVEILSGETAQHKHVRITRG
ncbi:MAG: hypothetical protein JWP08_226 [Bryobacterales bacterium]|nr:hypothetical protein [Bryobacterales bacterium]